MDRYRWNILRLCKIRWKNFGKRTIEEDHKVFFSGKEDKHKQGIGFLIHKDTVNTIMRCHSVSSRLTTIHWRAVPFNITVVQVYPPMLECDDNKIEKFYNQLQNVIDTKDRHSCCERRLECKSGQGCYETWRGICRPFCNDNTNERGLRLLEFATFNDLVLVNTFGYHKASRRWTWHNPNGQHHNQIDYILVRKRFQSGVNNARTQSFSEADIGSDHDLLMMTFHLRLKRIIKPKHTSLKFDLKKVKDPNVLETF